MQITKLPISTISLGESPPQSNFVFAAHGNVYGFSVPWKPYRRGGGIFFTHGRITVSIGASLSPSNEQTETDGTSSFNAYTVRPFFENVKCLTPYPSGTFARARSFKFPVKVYHISRKKSYNNISLFINNISIFNRSFWQSACNLLYCFLWKFYTKPNIAERTRCAFLSRAPLGAAEYIIFLFSSCADISLLRLTLYNAYFIRYAIKNGGKIRSRR